MQCIESTYDSLVRDSVDLVALDFRGEFGTLIVLFIISNCW